MQLQDAPLEYPQIWICICIHVEKDAVLFILVNMYAKIWSTRVALRVV